MINQQGQKLYAFTLLVAFSYISILGFLTAIEFGRIASVQQQPLDTFASTLKMDARNYQQIVEQGYNYHEDKRSLVAFFPIYPKLCSVVIKVAGWRTDECMLVVANFFLLLTYVVLYLLGMSLTPSCQQWALALFCLFPSTLFFRLGYAESMLCFFITMTLLGMQRQWPLWVVAVFAGLASGTRPVGFAMSIAVLWYVVVSCYDKNKTLASNTARLLWVIPVSCCGLIVYVCYLWWAFSAPLSFAHTQDHWTFLAPCGSTAWDKICSLS